MSLIRVFSSDYATAAANIVVFCGLLWAGLRISRNIIIRSASRVSSIARKTEQSQIYAELLKMRKYKRYPLSMIPAGLRLILIYFASIFLSGCAIVLIGSTVDRIVFDAEIGTSDYFIYLDVLNSPLYIAEKQIAFTVCFIFMILISTLSALSYLKPLQAAGSEIQFEERRKKILLRYLALRALR